MMQKKRTSQINRTQVSLSQEYRAALKLLRDIYSCDTSPLIQCLIHEAVLDIPARLHTCAAEMARDFFEDELRKKASAGKELLSADALHHGRYSKYLERPLLTPEKVMERISHPFRSKRVDLRAYYPRSLRRRQEGETPNSCQFRPETPQIGTPDKLREIFYPENIKPSLRNICEHANDMQEILCEMIFEGMEKLRATYRSVPSVLSDAERDDTTNIARVSKLKRAGLSPTNIALMLKARTLDQMPTEPSDLPVTKKRSTRPRTHKRPAGK